MANTERQLIEKLRNPDNRVVLEAVEELRERGWLSGNTLEGKGFQCADLRGADLRGANLRGVDLRMANLQKADLSGADLQGARLNRANLRITDLSGANLQGVDLFNTDLELANNLSDEQLAQARRLRAATMLDGSHYDGRFNLPGDLRDADVFHVDTNDPAAMASFYDVSLEEYQRGQEWADKHLSRIRREAEMEAAAPEVQLIVKLRHQDNRVVLEAVEELRECGWLNSGALKGVDLQHACLQGANLNLASMEGADLREADLEGADLGVANLQRANLSKANLQGARLLWTGLQGADLPEANLQGADLTGANLRKARLCNVNLQGAKLGATNLQKADLSGANLEGARNLREEELAKAHKLWGATMPDGTHYDGRFELPGDAEFALEESEDSIGEAVA